LSDEKIMVCRKAQVETGATLPRFFRLLQGPVRKNQLRAAAEASRTDTPFNYKNQLIMSNFMSSMPSFFCESVLCRRENSAIKILGQQGCLINLRIISRIWRMIFAARQSVRAAPEMPAGQ
jgi:hypothetical protein